MKVSLWAAASASLVFFGCGQQQQVKARIFERKQLENNRLMIKYEYIIRDKTYIDSITLKNRILSTDSLVVTIDPLHPQKAVPQF